MKICVLGDHHATQLPYKFLDGKMASPGLPINDIEVRQMFEFADRQFDLIFWSCSYPLMGCEALHILKELAAKPVENRILNYNSARINSGFYPREWWKSLENEDLQFLWSNYQEMMQHYLSVYGDKIVLIPLSVHYFDEKLELSLKATNILSELSTKIVDLSELRGLPEKYYVKEDQFLSPEGYATIKPKLEIFLKKLNLLQLKLLLLSMS